MRIEVGLGILSRPWYAWYAMRSARMSFVEHALETADNYTNSVIESSSGSEDGGDSVIEPGHRAIQSWGPAALDDDDMSMDAIEEVLVVHKLRHV